MTTIAIDDDFRSKSRLEQARIISEGMRAIDPEAFDAAAASVRRNMQALRDHAWRSFRYGSVQ